MSGNDGPSPIRPSRVLPSTDLIDEAQEELNNALLSYKARTENPDTDIESDFKEIAKKMRDLRRKISAA